MAWHHEPEPECQANSEILWHLRKNPSDKLKNIMTIGIYDEHPFFIKDIEKLVRFMYALIAKRTPQKSVTFNNMLTRKNNYRLPKQAGQRSKRAFYAKAQTSSSSSIRWLECKSKVLRKHIHYALCGHGGERWIVGAPLDGYDLTLRTVFQYHSCQWHGFPRCFPTNRNEIINHSQTRENCFLATVGQTRVLSEAGYCGIKKWECDDKKKQEVLPKKERRTYPHTIFYNFESFYYKSQQIKVTALLVYEMLMSQFQ